MNFSPILLLFILALIGTCSTHPIVRRKTCTPNYFRFHGRTSLIYTCKTVLVHLGPNRAYPIILSFRNSWPSRTPSATTMTTSTTTLASVTTMNYDKPTSTTPELASPSSLGTTVSPVESTTMTRAASTTDQGQPEVNVAASSTMPPAQPVESTTGEPRDPSVTIQPNEPSSVSNQIDEQPSEKMSTTVSPVDSSSSTMVSSTTTGQPEEPIGRSPPTESEAPRVESSESTQAPPELIPSVTTATMRPEETNRPQVDDNLYEKSQSAENEVSPATIPPPQALQSRDSVESATQDNLEPE